MSTINDEYLVIRWHAQDVQRLKPEWSLDQCQAFLSNNERIIKDRLIEDGWEVLQSVIQYSE
jgi:hypothetical protein